MIAWRIGDWHTPRRTYLPAAPRHRVSAVSEEATTIRSPLQEQMRERADELRARAAQLLDEIEDVHTELAALGAAEAEFTRGLIRKVKRERDRNGTVPPELKPNSGDGDGPPPPSDPAPSPPDPSPAPVDPPPPEREVIPPEIREETSDGRVMRGQKLRRERAAVVLAYLVDAADWRKPQDIIDDTGLPRHGYQAAVRDLVDERKIISRGTRTNLMYRVQPESKNDGIEKPPEPAERTEAVELQEGDYAIVSAIQQSGAGSLTAEGIAIKCRVGLALIAPRLEALTTHGFIQRGMRGTVPVYAPGKRRLPPR